MFFAFVYVADRIATISFNVGSWLVYQTANGMYYVYNKMRGDYITITHEEYNKLLQNQK